jgi:pyridoxine kinase
MNVLSIQSAVAYGHVGNSAAVFALQRLGHEAWPLDTVQYSNHPGHGAWQGRTVEADRLRVLLDGLDRHGVLGRCDAVLSGYLGTAENGAVALDAATRVQATNGDALYCCDPVIGNTRKGRFVPEEVADFIRTRALPRADILIPNRFELGLLAGAEIGDAAAARQAAESLSVPVVVTTGLRRDDRIGVLACVEGGSWLVEAPFLDNVTDDGAGDLLSALFLGRYLLDRALVPALEHAVAATFAVIAATRAAGVDELCLVAAQDQLVAPARRFTAVPLP